MRIWWSGLGQWSLHHHEALHSTLPSLLTFEFNDSNIYFRGFDIPGISDQVSVTNKINILLRFSLAEVVVHMSKLSDKVCASYHIKLKTGHLPIKL